LGFEKYDDELREFLKNYNADKEDQARVLLAKKRTQADNAEEEQESVKKRAVVDDDPDYLFE
jgi:hypothetical protein